ncbi:DM13 domain-containing protein [Flagellimonas sp.]|uniref:DM13 domain-containing protein n=1 Tax=Flagellimonas sp. TaxID=2058762 RepID=UPI003F49E0DB
MKTIQPFQTILFTLLVMLSSISMVSQTTSKGTWQKQNKSISGHFEIEKANDATYIVLSDDFKTKSAPDLKLFLSKKRVSDITGKNATKDAVLISELKKTKGGQRYKVPSNVQLVNYTSLIIHCEQYSIFWGGGAIPK